jgi:hypothetical protein
MWPLTQRTGVPSVDRVLDAYASGDPRQMLAVIEYTPWGCRDASFMAVPDGGRPPLCRPGEAEGTLVPTFVTALRRAVRPDETTVDDVTRLVSPGSLLLGISERRNMPGARDRWWVIFLVAPRTVDGYAIITPVTVGDVGWTGSGLGGSWDLEGLTASTAAMDAEPVLLDEGAGRGGPLAVAPAIPAAPVTELPSTPAALPWFVPPSTIR